MTKASRLLPLAWLLLLAGPSATAHGAPEAREIDHRVLLDDDGIVPFEGCFSEQCAGSQALDLLALEVREAALPTGEPVVVFRLLVQSETAASDRAVDLAFSAGGSEWTFDWLSDGASFTSTTFEAVAGPFDVGDGHPKAVEGSVRHATLGIAPGDAISGITLQSRLGEEVADLMPGSWMVQGTEVPAVREDPTAAEPEPGAYTVAGPAPLLSVSASGTMLHEGPVAVTVGNPLETLEQLVTVSVSGSGAATPMSLLLGPGETGTVSVTMTNGTDAVNLTVASDLGGHGSIAFDAIPPTHHDGNATDDPDGHGDDGHAHDDGEDKGSPSLPGLLVLAVALAVAAVRRR